MESVYVSHVEDAVTFWTQSINRIHDINYLSEKLAKVCSSMSSIFGAPNTDMIYGGLFSADKCWYRCKLQNVINDEQCLVTYIDYGNSEVLNRSYIVELPEELQFPAIAQKYRLWGLQLNSSADVEQGLTFLNTLISDKRISVSPKATYQDGTIVAQVYLESIDVGEEIAKSGFAERCITAGSPNSKGEKIEDSTTDLKQRNVWVGRKIERLPMREPKNLSIPNRFANIQSICDSWKENACSNNLPASRLNPVPDMNVENDTNCNKKLLEEIKQLRDERNTLLQKSNALECQLKQLQDKFEKEKLYSDETILEMERSMKMAVGNKLKSLTAKVEVLKTVRRENENMHIGDDILEAVGVVTKEEISAPSSLCILEESWMEYNLAQEMIQCCSEKAKLDELIASRNEVQKTLHNSIETFILEVDELSLATRTAKLQTWMQSLSRVYGPPGDCKCADVDFEEFFKWKQAKIEQFTHVKDNTNNSLAALLAWLSNMREFFDLTLDSSLGSSEVQNIDDILDHVELDISKELELCLLELNDTDRETILNAYNGIIEKIHKELQLIDVVRSKYSSSLEFKKNNVNWLNRSPNVENLMSIKKNLKALKSQLRWKLVECSSLEESEECDEIVLMELKEQSNELRDKIFCEICREQDEYAMLSNLVQKWFPELPLIHPEAEILNYMNSGGLLSVSLERDLLDAQPMKELSSKRPLVHASFQNKRVLIKGYSVGMDTEEKVIERASQYHKAWSESKEDSGLMPLIYIFFCKSDPLVYIMVPFYPGESLGAIQDNNFLKSKEILKVMSGVAQGLQILHAANIIVGSLHENNIFAINRERGIIGDFDFTKDGAQRSSSSSVSFPHLRAPELTMGHPASMSSDMYAYGCILLWLYTRNKEFSFKDDGTISLHGLGLDSKLEYLLSHLLCSRDRMQAENVKSHEYFQMTEERVNSMSDGETQHIPADFA